MQDSYSDVKQRLEETKDQNIFKCTLSRSIGAILMRPYKVKSFTDAGEKALFGRASLDNLRWVKWFGSSDMSQPALEIGHLCQMAVGSEIIIGGEHNNSRVINNAMELFPELRHLAKQNDINIEKSFSKGPVKIGSNVTISKSIILSGVSIGHGAVVGAGSLVTKDVPDFAIVAGNPAKIIGYRFDEKMIEILLKSRWWDLNYVSFIKYFNHIQNLDKTESQELILSLDESHYDKDQNFFVVVLKELEKGGVTFDIAGVEVNGTFIKRQDFPRELQFFCKQLWSKPGDPIYMIPDIFKFAGLTGETALPTPSTTASFNLDEALI